jgi:uncharacterized membrane protein
MLTNGVHDWAMYRDHGWYGGGGHPVFGWILMLLFLALLVVLVIAAVRWLMAERHPHAAGAGSGRGSTDDALAIARTRYARGEIDREAFLRLSEDLSTHPHAGPP